MSSQYKNLKDLQSKEIERVVVRGANWIGDAAMTVPALRALRRVLPRAQIILATPARAEGIFTDVDFIDELLSIESGRSKINSTWRQAREWKAKRFDLAVLLPNSFGVSLIAALAGVRVRVGYATDNRRLLLTHSVRVPTWRGQRHEVFHYLNIIAELERALIGTTEVEAREPVTDIFVTEMRRAEARKILRAHSWTEARSLVILCPGATNSRAKRWPIENFAALADSLIEGADAQVALIGAPEELEISNAVTARMRHRPLVLTGRTSLAETVAMLSVADLLVTNDTGPAHLAAAVRTPTLVIFGPTDPVTTRPFSASAEIARRPPACAPCMLRDCPIDHRCMTAITPAEVTRRALALIENRVRVAENVAG